jgi:hypothetical protein
MKKTSLYIIIIAILFSGSSFTVEAQSSKCIPGQKDGLTEYCLLAPLPLDGPNNLTEKTTAAEFIPGLFQLAIMLATGLAVLMIIWGGVQYMSTDAWGGKNDAKNTIWNAIMGLLLTLSSWLIINTISPGLLQFNLSLDPVKIQKNTNLPTSSAETQSTGGLTQQQAKALLEAGGVSVSGPILLAGVNQRTINEVIGLKNVCGSNCEVTVTSATGGTHAPGTCSHGNGYKVDVRLNETLNSYISRNYSSLPNRSDGARMYQAPSGALYAQESNHWDIVVPCN